MSFARYSPAVLLVIPDVFHLGWMGETKRLFHLAHALHKIGYKIVLLAGKVVKPAAQAPIDEEFPGLVIRTKHIGDYPNLLNWSPQLRRTWRALWKARGEDHYWSKLSWGWADRLRVDHVAADLEEKQIDVRIVWGANTGYLDGAVAAARLASVLQIPWVFELQDPPRRTLVEPLCHSVIERFKNLLGQATGVVVTTNSYRNKLLQQYSLDGSKVHVLPLTFDGKWASLPSPASVTDSQPFRILYAGSLSGGRSLAPLISAMAKLLREYPQIRQKITLDLMGGGPGFHEAEKVARNLSVNDLLSIHGQVLPSAVEEKIRECNLIVIVQENHCAIQVPGKIFETLFSLKPVLGLMPPDCEAASILVRSGLGQICATNNVDCIAATLYTMWSNWLENKDLIEPNLAFIEDFSVRKLPAKLQQILMASGMTPLATHPVDQGTS